MARTKKPKWKKVANGWLLEAPNGSLFVYRTKRLVMQRRRALEQIWTYGYKSAGTSWDWTDSEEQAEGGLAEAKKAAERHAEAVYGLDAS